MIPIILTSGSHYEVGKQVGERFKDVIQDYYAKDGDFNDKVFPFIQTTKGTEVYNGFLEAVKKVFPKYIEEMQGLADGAELTFQQVFTMHLSRELRIWLLINEEWGCSDLFINYPKTNQIALGHNEDINPEVKGRAYIVRATIYGDTSANGERSIEEEFTAYTYPGHLPGSAFGFNSSGMVFNCNGLPPRLISFNKIPRYVLNRAMLGAKTPRAFEDVLQCKGIGSAYGFSVNVIQVEPNKSPAMWNYEVAPVKEKPTTLFHKISIGPEGDTGFDKTGHYFHCNKYTHLDTEQIPQLARSSIARLERFSELPTPKTIDDVCKVLEDEAVEKYPIFRSPRPTDRNATVAVALYNFVMERLDIYEDKPCRSIPVVSLKFPSGELIENPSSGQ